MLARRVVEVSTTAYYNAGKHHQEPGVEKCAAVRGGTLRVLRIDNDPEFISHEMTQRAAKQDTVDAFIPPGMPWHNGFVESFHKRLRDELLERRDVRLPRSCVTLSVTVVTVL